MTCPELCDKHKPKPTYEEIAREAAEMIDQLQQDGEIGVPSLTKIILAAMNTRGVAIALTKGRRRSRL